MKIGILGCGAIAPTHAEALKGVDGADLAAVFDIVPEKSAALSEKFEVPAYPSLSEFFDSVDAVSICVPSGLHAEVAIQAAAAGKPAIVEKPLDIQVGPAKRMVEAFESAGLNLACVSQHRFSAQVRRLQQAAQSGDMGRLIQGDAIIKWYRTQQYYDSGDWRGTWALDGGGCLMNQGVHYIDMIQWIMGGVKSVQALCRTLAHDIEVEDTAMAMVEYKNGAVGLIQGSTSVYPGLAERLEVHGTYGSVILEGDRAKLWQIDAEKALAGKYGDGVMQQPTPSLHLAAPVDPVEEDLTAKWGEQHRLQLQDFVDSVREGRPPFFSGREALEPLKVILAIYESSRNGGQRVEVS